MANLEHDLKLFIVDKAMASGNNEERLQAFKEVVDFVNEWKEQNVSAKMRLFSELGKKGGIL